jgi:hypothetical protein
MRQCRAVSNQADLARRARNVVAQTILRVSLSPLDPPPATISTLIDLLEPLNELTRTARTARA